MIDMKIGCLPTPGNFSTYYNSTYGIIFQSPDGWKKVEILSSDYTFIEFTSPPPPASNAAGAQVVISVEKRLGNVTTLQQYGEAVDKFLHLALGNFSSTKPISTTLSGQPAMIRVFDVKQPTSLVTIAQVFTVKDGKAYAITYTAPSSRYSSYLPTVQQIINSFQITK
jgi:hypothetical protein